MTASNNLDRVRTAFDDPNLVANAGLMLPGTLAQRLRLQELFDEHVALGDVPGSPNPGKKSMTVISGPLAGADCIDQMDVLRAGGSAAVVGHVVAAATRSIRGSVVGMRTRHAALRASSRRRSREHGMRGQPGD